MASRRSSGFTLIELMIVVFIIGVLTAIAVPNFIAIQNRAKEGETARNMHLLQLAVEDYMVSHDGALPTSAQEVAPFLPPNGEGNHELTNAFTHQPIDYLHPAPGNIRLDTDSTRYVIIGWGNHGQLSLQLSNWTPGQDVGGPVGPLDGTN